MLSDGITLGRELERRDLICDKKGFEKVIALIDKGTDVFSRLNQSKWTDEQIRRRKYK